MAVLNDAQALYYGATEISKAYLGDTLVWQQQVAATTWEDAWASDSLSVFESWYINNTGPKVAIDTANPLPTTTVNSQAVADSLAGKLVVGSVAITVSNITLRNFKVISDGSGSGVIDITGGLTGIVVEDFEIDGAGLLTPATGVGGGSWANVTMRRGNIHHCLDRVRAFEGSLYEYMYLHQSTVNPDYSGNNAQHSDAVQWVRGGAGKPSRVTRSWLESTPDGPNVISAVIIKSDAGSIDDVTVDYCYLNGGAYMVIVEAGANGAPTNVKIRNNRFGRNYRNGVWSGAGIDPATIDRTGNVWYDDRTPVTLTWGLLN